MSQIVSDIRYHDRYSYIAPIDMDEAFVSADRRNIADVLSDHEAKGEFNSLSIKDVYYTHMVETK